MDVRLSRSLRFNVMFKSPEAFVKMQILLKVRVRWGGVRPEIVLFSKSKCIRKLTVMLRNFNENKLVLPFISLIFFSRLSTTAVLHTLKLLQIPPLLLSRKERAFKYCSPQNPSDNSLSQGVVKATPELGFLRSFPS